MTRKNKIIISLAAIVLGWLLNGIAWTATLEATVSTFFLLSGIAFFIGGLLYFIIIVTRK